MGMYFNRGTLPWQGLEAETKEEKYEKIKEKKLATPVEELCKDTFGEFATFINYCRNMTFEQKPDYPFLRRMLKDLFFRQGLEFDFKFDWQLKMEERAAAAND